MLRYAEVVGRREDWARVVTDIEMIETPFLAWLPVEREEVKQAELLYQADAFDAPEENSHPDGSPVEKFKSAGRNRRQLRALIQYSTKAAEVSKLTQEAGNNAAIANELAREITRQTKELSKDMEAACLSTQECRIGDDTQGYLTRGVPNWIQTTAQSVYPVDELLRPTSAQISTVASTSITEDVILNILEAIGRVTRSRRTVTLFCGPRLKRLINNMPMFLPSVSPSGTTGLNQGAIIRQLRGVYDRVVESFNTDFCPLDIILSYNMDALNPNNTASVFWGYFLHRDMWALQWHTKPEWNQKPYEGGRYQAFCEAIWRLICWHPGGEGKITPAS